MYRPNDCFIWTDEHLEAGSAKPTRTGRFTQYRSGPAGNRAGSAVAIEKLPGTGERKEGERKREEERERREERGRRWPQGVAEGAESHRLLILFRNRGESRKKMMEGFLFFFFWGYDEVGIPLPTSSKKYIFFKKIFYEVGNSFFFMIFFLNIFSKKSAILPSSSSPTCPCFEMKQGVGGVPPPAPPRTATAAPSTSPRVHRRPLHRPARSFFPSPPPPFDLARNGTEPCHWPISMVAGFGSANLAWKLVLLHVQSLGF